jgi:hypothetical protein
MSDDFSSGSVVAVVSTRGRFRSKGGFLGGGGLDDVSIINVELIPSTFLPSPGGGGWRMGGGKRDNSGRKNKISVTRRFVGEIVCLQTVVESGSQNMK